VLDIVAEIRDYLAKDKVKAARKTYEKAVKAGARGPQLKEAAFELTLAEGGGAPAAELLRELREESGGRLAAALALAASHLRRRRDDHVLRDALWEAALDAEDYPLAVAELATLLEAGAVDAARRARMLVDRKDEVGALGLFLLASLGAVKTDRVTLAKRLARAESSKRRIARLTEALREAGREDGPINLVLAQAALERGDRQEFLERSTAAASELRDEVLTWTGSLGPEERMDLALRLDLVPEALRAAAEMGAEALAAVAQRLSGDTVTVRAVRGIAALVQGKVANACRILEDAVRRAKDSAPAIADLLRAKAGQWAGAQEAFASVVAEASGRPNEVAEAVEMLLHVKEAARGEAWARAGGRILDLAPEREDLRTALGLLLLAGGDEKEAAKLLEAPEHLAAARRWAEAGKTGPAVLRAAAELADRNGRAAEHAEWILKAARGDAALLAELGRKLAGSAVSAATVLRSAAALLQQGEKQEAAGLLARLPLDRDSGAQIDRLVKEHDLGADRAFQLAQLRAALAQGDGQRSRRLVKSAGLDPSALVEDARRHADAARLLAEILVEQERPQEVVGLLEARRAAGDPPRLLLPLADALLRGPGGLPAARLLRARLLHGAKRDADAVRDLRAIPPDAREAEEAFALLGELTKGEAGAGAALGRADILFARRDYDGAVRELASSGAPPADRLDRYEAVCRARPSLDAAHRGRAVALLEMGRVAEAAEAHFRRFGCPDADSAAVAADLEAVARKSIEAGDLATAVAILERLPDQVSDGAERALAAIGDDRRAPMLILRSKMLLHLERAEEAVQTLSELVAADPGSRAKAAEALAAIVESGHARPEADFALARAHQTMEQTARALAALRRLYEDDITAKENVVAALERLLAEANEPEARLFLAQVFLDLRDARGATEQAVQARRVRPGVRREAVDVLRRALDLDAFAPETHFALAEAHLAGDEADDAVRHFRAAVEVDRGRAAAAIRAMEEAAPRSAHPALLWLAVGTTYAEFQRDFRNAVRAFTAGLEAKPPAELRVPLLLGRGDAFAALREDDRAFDDFDEASRLDLLERRYYEFLRSRHRRRVLAAAEEARARAPQDFGAAADVVGRFLRLGRTQEAVLVAQRALSSFPNEVAAQYLVGVALHAAGRYDAAARALEAVRARAGADTEMGRAARMLLAESYLDGGDRDSARACLTEIEAVDAAYPGLMARRSALAPPADDPHAPPPLFVRPEFPRPTE